MWASIASASRISLTLEAATGVIITIDSGPGASRGRASLAGVVAVARSDIFEAPGNLRGRSTLPSREGHGNLPAVVTFDTLLRELRGKTPEIDPATLDAALHGTARPALIDVREPDEHAQGMIPGTLH